MRPVQKRRRDDADGLHTTGQAKHRDQPDINRCGPCACRACEPVIASAFCTMLDRRSISPEGVEGSKVGLGNVENTTAVHVEALPGLMVTMPLSSVGHKLHSNKLVSENMVCPSRHPSVREVTVIRRVRLIRCLSHSGRCSDICFLQSFSLPTSLSAGKGFVGRPETG